VLQPHKGTIQINICELETLVQQLKKLKDTLDDQKCHVSSLQHRYDHAITGTVPSIRKFDERFDHWMHLLNTVIGDIDIAYHTLRTVHEEAREGDIPGALEALRDGSQGQTP
jgi:hypothetical protein